MRILATDFKAVTVIVEIFLFPTLIFFQKIFLFYV